MATPTRKDLRKIGEDILLIEEMINRYNITHAENKIIAYHYGTLKFYTEDGEDNSLIQLRNNYGFK